MRQFSYITVGKILQELEADGLRLTRVTFSRLEDRLNLPKARRTNGKLKWRVYSREEADKVKDLIKREYNFQA
jgi:arginine repressor